MIGFASGGKARRPGLCGESASGSGEVETLYLLDDYRDRGVGRRLMRAMAAHLAAVGCRSVVLWVLRDNPTRWFYQRLGGRAAARESIRFAGRQVEQVAYLWDPIRHPAHRDRRDAGTLTRPEARRLRRATLPCCKAP